MRFFKTIRLKIRNILDDKYEYTYIYRLITTVDRVGATARTLDNQIAFDRSIIEQKIRFEYVTSRNIIGDIEEGYLFLFDGPI